MQFNFQFKKNNFKMSTTLYLNNSRDLDSLLGYLHLPPKAIDISKTKKFGCFGDTGPTIQCDDTVVSGLATVTRHLSDIAEKFSNELKSFNGLNSAEKSEILQWLFYCQTQLSSCNDMQTLSIRAEELNDFLADKAFLVGNHFTLADLMIFQKLHNFMAAQTFSDKEKFIHLSRWFDQVQFIPKTRHKLPTVHFHKTKLYTS